jgi:hypothetical protein
MKCSFRPSGRDISSCKSKWFTEIHFNKTNKKISMNNGIQLSDLAKTNIEILTDGEIHYVMQPVVGLQLQQMCVFMMIMVSKEP